MFNKQIIERMAQDQKGEEKRNRMQQLELEKLGGLPGRRVFSSTKGQHVPLKPEDTKSESSSGRRLAAGFNDTEDDGASASTRIPFARKSSDEDDNDEDAFIPTSLDEIQEEYDPDTEDVQYPRQGYPTGEMLLEEYNELVAESVDNVRRPESRSSRQKAGVNISRQPSRLQGNVLEEDDDEIVEDKNTRKSRKSSDKLLKKASLIKNSSKASVSKDISRAGSSGRKGYTDAALASPRDSVTDNSSRSNSGGERYSSKDRIGRSSSKTSKDRERESSSRSRERIRERSASKERSSSSRDRVSSRDSSNRERRSTESKQRLLQSGSKLMESMSRIGSVASSLANIGSNYAPGISSNRLNSISSTVPPQSGGSSLVFREVAPLPIEIPDHVTDEEEFRRYLSVRRRAVPYLYDDSDEADDANENEVTSPFTPFQKSFS